MNNKEFKMHFDYVAKENGFEKAFGAWWKQTSESLVVLYLQKSNFGNYYDLLIKVFFHGFFGNQYTKNKELISKTPSVLLGAPSEYNKLFDLDDPIEDQIRIVLLKKLFATSLVPKIIKAMTKDGVINMYHNKEIVLLPRIKELLGLKDSE